MSAFRLYFLDFSTLITQINNIINHALSNLLLSPELLISPFMTLSTANKFTGILSFFTRQHLRKVLLLAELCLVIAPSEYRLSFDLYLYLGIYSVFSLFLVYASL